MASQSNHDMQDSLVLGMNRSEMAERFRAGTQRVVAEHLAAGQPVYGSCSTTDVYAVLPQDSTATSTRAQGSATPESRAS